MNNCSRNKMSPDLHSRGGVLVFVILSLVVLIGAMGVAFDSFLATTSRTQYQGMADRLALAVLETYLVDYERYRDPTSAIDRAVTRGQDLLGLNVSLLITKGYFANSSSQQDLRANLGGATSGTSGYIQPGRWFEQNPPCSTEASAFCPLTQNELDAGTQPNAFHVRIGVNPNSPIRTMFTKVLGSDSYTTGAHATASLTPRRAAFLIDLSGSIHDTTHNAVPTSLNPPGIQSLYAYKLRSGIDCSGTSYPIPASDILNLAEEYPLYFSDISSTDNPREIYAALDPINPTGLPQTNQRKHYQDDFQCFDVDTDGDGANDESYAIDVVTAPQPLTDVLTGIKRALEEFRDRAVAGDRIMVLGFDDEILPVRSTHDSSNNPIMVPPNQGNTTNPEFQRMLYAVSDPAGFSHIPTLFFPRQWGRYGPGSPYLTSFDPRLGGGAQASQIISMWGLSSSNPLPPIPAQTDMIQPITVARAALKGELNWRSSDNFAVIFSDGKANCPNAGYIRAHGLEHYCSSTRFDFYSTAIDSTRGLINNQTRPEYSLVGDNIAVHFALSGQSSQPHTLLRGGMPSQNGQSIGCLSDVQARHLPGRMGTYVISTYNSFPDSFSTPNRFYSDVSKTGGLWVPLRPPCRHWTPTNCTGYSCYLGFEVWVGWLCTQSRPVGDGIAEHLSLSGYFDPDEFSQQVQDVNGNGISNAGLDGVATRIFCDMGGRSVATQITDMFSQIMTSNPYTIVQ